MNSIKPYIDSLLKIWEENSPAARIGILFLITLCVVGIGTVGYWSVQPNYVVLVSDLKTEKVDQVLDALAKAGIETQLAGAGGVVMVDRRDLTRAKAIVRSEGVAESATFFSDAGGPLSDPGSKRFHELKLQELQLAETIKKFTVVDQADVHLNVPEKGPFARKYSTPTASVLLTLRPGTQLSEVQAQTIASQVAFSIADLKPENVQIADKDGRNYSQPDEQVKQISTQVEYVDQAERKLADKAMKQLIPILGFGNSTVEVALDLTFTNGSRTITKYDADGKVPSEEDLDTTTTTNVDTTPAGPAGTAANLQTRRRGSSNVEEKSERITTSYLVPKTEEVETNTTPIKNQMTVSVVVNSEAQGIKAEDGSLLPGIQAKVEDIVKTAVGYNQTSDIITVEFLPFTPSELSAEPAPAPFEWNKVTDIVEKTSLAIASLFAFLMGMLLLRKVRPISEPDDSSATPLRSERERSESLNQLSEMIKNNPEVFAQVVKSWTGGDNPGAPSRTRAA